MINLLPPGIKDQIAYSKHNAMVLRYVWLLALVVIAVVMAYGSTSLYLATRVNRATSDVEARQKLMDTKYKGLEAKVKTVNGRLTAIKNLEQNQAKFSQVLSDLAKVTPKGVYISNLSLTGDAAKPLQIQGVADSYASATGFREALANSPRISGADLQNVATQPGGFGFTITVGFRPGSAK